MSTSETNIDIETGSSTTVEERKETTNTSASNDAAASPSSPSVGDRVGESKSVPLCRHVMESGACCQSPALRNRRFCYSHLRLRGERIRMARAIAHRQPYRLMLPALDDIAGVRVAAARVADALAAGVLEPQRAGRLVYTFQQISSALRWEAKARLNPTREETGAPPLSPVGDRVGDDQKLLVEEYPEFEAEFGLPAGLDLSQPPHVLFPPPEQTWPTATAAVGAAAQVPAYNDPPPSCHRWTREGIELEDLDKRREYMSDEAYYKESRKITDRISNQVKTEMRKQQEAEWQAEADRRNAFEAEKSRIYRNMDDGQRRAYHVGVLAGLETAKRDAEAEEEARKKKPAAKAVAS